MKNSSNQLLGLFMTIALVLGIWSCSEDSKPAPPQIANPAVTPVNVGGTAAITFTVVTPGGFQRADILSVTGGTAEVFSQPANGDTEGQIVMTFVAGTIPGAGSINIVITDNSNQTAQATAVVTINNSSAPTMQGPSDPIEVSKGQAAEMTFGISIPGGYASAEATTTSGNITIDAQPAVGDINGVINLTLDATAEPGAQTVTLTVTDAENQTVQGTAEVFVVDKVTVSENITSDVTWTTGQTVELTKRIAVEDGVTLTIEEGVVIKGAVGEGSNASALLIARGAKLMAMGTAAKPIIFTSMVDQIQPGQIESPNIDPSQTGLWGGLLILGKAPISAKGGAEAVQIEGIPPSDTNGLYGGNVADDNSGTIRYISIRHGGSDIGEGNEINGLTLGGVGSGTTIEYVEVVSNRDDGIEYFGGTVNTTNTVVWGVGDDSYDSDQAWDGTADNFVAILENISDHGMEIDGPESATNPDGVNKFTNGTIKAKASASSGNEYADLRSDAKVNLTNIYFFNGTSSSDLELDNNGVATNYLNELINFTSLQFNESHQSEARAIGDIIIEKTGDNEQPLDVFTTRPLDVSVVVTDSPTVGANVTVFENWTLTHAAGALTGF